MIFRQRFFNRYLILSACLLFITLFLSFALQTGYFKVLFFFKPSPEFETQEAYMTFHFSLDMYIENGVRYQQLIAPLIISFSALHFLTEKTGYFVNIYGRVKNYRTTVIKSVFCHAAASALYLFGAYLVFFLLGKVVAFGPIFENPVMHYMSDIFGPNFYEEHYSLFYLIDGFIKFGVFPFFYSIFCMSVAFVTEKKYLFVLLPTLYFFMMSVAMAALPKNIFGFSNNYLAPAHVFAIQAAVYPPFYTAFTGLIIPLVIAVILITCRLKGREKFAV